VRELFLQLPSTHKRFNASDRDLAAKLYRSGIPWELLRSALLLATARRICAAHCLSPVRSLYYFLPVLDEIKAQPLPPGYLQYLESKIAHHRCSGSS
jgi:hypothetical protein